MTDKEFVDILRLSDDVSKRYAADRIADLEKQRDVARAEVATEYVRGREHEQHAKMDADLSWKERADKAKAQLADAVAALREIAADPIRTGAEDAIQRAQDIATAALAGRTR